MKESISFEELDRGQRRSVESDDKSRRLEAARKGRDLDVLKDDPDPEVRREVARQGAFLEQLKDDHDPDVRAAVASRGVFLEQFKDDHDPDVRAVVADQGAFLDQLKDDPDPFIRKAARFELARHVNAEGSKTRTPGLHEIAEQANEEASSYLVDPMRAKERDER